MLTTLRGSPPLVLRRAVVPDPRELSAKLKLPVLPEE